jgi:hypothetical protein
VTPTESPTTDEDMRARWVASPHAEWLRLPDPEYEPDCMQCHAPLAILDVEQASGQSLSDKADESSPEPACLLCHPQTTGEHKQDVAWLIDADSAKYEPVATIDESCRGCHVADGVDGHLFIQLEGVHADFLCTDCHDPHTAEAGCSDHGCHQPFRAECEPIQTHDKPHAAASCSACHASGEVEIGWDEDRQVWESFYAVEAEGLIELESHTSHDLDLEVVCERCHTPGDLPWDR